ncbi:hypothetical protein [Janthinobacterium fluminis]|uniref:Uncharacterized protein n=1 Tax=Janthinobacterium fluminis TaxID=2987524 RepID=A0ABT5JYT3_9BURK|nr:hypothetical protein [Janthinobacterium fluminis]MDC8757878.1 hypothetical protein [Janthinobacterium fluminis]
MMLKLISCAGVLLLSACAARPLPRPAATCAPPAQVAPAAAVNELLAYQAGLRLLTPAELGKALAEANAHDAHDARAALRRAMLLAAQRGAGDLGRAQALLDAVAQSAVPDEQVLKPLAQFLAAGYADARRQDEAADRLGQQLREGQRRNEQLNDKLEALKNIERTLSVRPAPAAK